MKFAPKRRNNSSIMNLTPLIDCMFLLVIFIMIVARFEPDGGIPVNLPTAKSTSESSKQPATLNLTVTDDGRIYLDHEEVQVDNLEQAIIDARTRAGDPEGKEIVLVVFGDKDARHSRVVDALDAAARAKQQKVTIRTRK